MGPKGKHTVRESSQETWRKTTETEKAQQGLRT